MATVIGQHKIRIKLNKITSKDLPKAYSSAMTAITLMVKGESQKRTPVDTGYLKSSAYSNIIGVNKLGVKGIVGYIAKYAIYVHEHTWKKHVVGEAKFLENAVKIVSKKVNDIFAHYIKHAGLK